MTDNIIKNIDVNLVEENDGDFYLVFSFDENIKICLTSSDSSDLKEFFVKLMNELIKENFVLVFNSEDQDIYSNISRTYVQQLNTEIKSIYNSIPEIPQ